jgi:predicted DNA binding CopG/RHH family protein
MNNPAKKQESEYERYNREAREKPHAPEFSSIEEEAEFWQTHDSEDYYSEPVEEEMQFVPARRTKAMAVRLEPETFAALEKRARALGIGPSTLTRMWILEHLQREAN